MQKDDPQPEVEAPKQHEPGRCFECGHTRLEHGARTFEGFLFEGLLPGPGRCEICPCREYHYMGSYSTPLPEIAQ